MEITLDPAIARDITFQQYPTAPDIDGVCWQSLGAHRALEGTFFELMRLNAGQLTGLGVPFSMRQLSLSVAAPGRLNAFHLHPKVTQDELWCVVHGEMLVWLIDVRALSPTRGHRRAFVLTGAAPGWLHIPTGVAHGYRAGVAGATLLYAASAQFNPDDPNEGRLPWDYFGAELWDPDRG
jgi:dTDP-4-dehydrorhamnose 3,5-epimerase